MGDITKNISKHELDCRCGRNDCEATIFEYEPVVRIIQGACNHFEKALGLKKVTLDITSGARCFEYNRQIGSNDNSQHPRCRAIDHRILEVPIKDLADYYSKRYPSSHGLGVYETFVHLDSRPIRARWKG